MFKWIKNISNRVPNPRKFVIGTTTAIEKGEVVKLSNGTIVAVGDTDQDDPYVGIAAVEHDGSTDDGVQKAEEIRVYDHPDDIFELVPRNVITATGGSTTTFVDSNILPATDDIFNGGYLQIVTCAADSSLIGKKVKISDFTGATGTFTLAETLPAALASGDTAYLCPGKRAIGQYGWDLNSDGTDINFESSGGESLELYSVDPGTFKTFWKLRLHQFGNDAAAK